MPFNEHAMSFFSAGQYRVVRVPAIGSTAPEVNQMRMINSGLETYGGLFFVIDPPKTQPRKCFDILLIGMSRPLLAFEPKRKNAPPTIIVWPHDVIATTATDYGLTT